MNGEAELVVTLKDIRAMNHCSSGARQWFKSNGLDWMDFLKNGIPASKLLEVNDALGRRLVEFTLKNKNGQQ